MAEYIDKQALITEIQSSVSMVLQTAPYEKVWFDRFVDRQNEIMAIIERQPTAEVEPGRHGHRIRLDAHKGVEQFKCSFCRSECDVPTCMDNPMYGYCPNCSARMDGGADGAN